MKKLQIKLPVLLLFAVSFFKLSAQLPANPYPLSSMVYYDTQSVFVNGKYVNLRVYGGKTNYKYDHGNRIIEKGVAIANSGSYLFNALTRYIYEPGMVTTVNYNLDSGYSYKYEDSLDIKGRLTSKRAYIRDSSMSQWIQTSYWKYEYDNADRVYYRISITNMNEILPRKIVSSIIFDSSGRELSSWQTENMGSKEVSKWKDSFRYYSNGLTSFSRSERWDSANKVFKETKRDSGAFNQNLNRYIIYHYTSYSSNPSSIDTIYKNVHDKDSFIIYSTFQDTTKIRKIIEYYENNGARIRRLTFENVTGYSTLLLSSADTAIYNSDKNITYGSNTKYGYPNGPNPVISAFNSYATIFYNNKLILTLNNKSLTGHIYEELRKYNSYDLTTYSFVRNKIDTVETLYLYNKNNLAERINYYYSHFRTNGQQESRGKAVEFYTYIDNNAIETPKATEAHIEIYPQPVHNILNIKSGVSIGRVQVCIMSLQGQVISTSQLIGNKEEILDVSGLENGMYFIQLQKQGQIQNFKIIKE